MFVMMRIVLNHLYRYQVLPNRLKFSFLVLDKLDVRSKAKNLMGRRGREKRLFKMSVKEFSRFNAKEF